MIETPVKHPAKYSDIFLPTFANIAKDYNNLLDPFAGTGKIAMIKDYGYEGKITCNELEPDWIDFRYLVDQWHFGDAEFMDWAANDEFDIIITSPVYGNRMSDHYDIEKHKATGRRAYQTFLGHDLHEENTGRMQWGTSYREKHRRVWIECRRVLEKKGLLVLNISDHIRNKEVVRVTDWHLDTLWELGFIVEDHYKIPTQRYKRGTNNEARVEYESIVVLRNKK